MLTFGLVLTISGLLFNQMQNRQKTVAIAVSAQESTPTEVVLVAKEAPTTLALLSADEELGSPALQAVAGTSQTSGGQIDSGFRVLDQTDQTQASCQSAIFKIGDIESSSFDHPADEFNWVGALDVLPDWVDPFIVGQNQDADFPWRTSQDEAGNPENRIRFTYSGGKTTAQLIISWSPGTTGQASKLVYLDDEFVGSTGTQLGKFTQGTWQNMPLVQSQIDMPLTVGEHTLAIKSVNNGHPTIWDYISLNADCANHP